MKNWLLLQYYLLFYRLKFLNAGADNAGWYLTKRIGMWLIFFPVILSLRIIYNALRELGSYFLVEIFSYESHWIRNPSRKLTRRQKIYFTKRLSDIY